jgi:hypothetical protein
MALMICRGYLSGLASTSMPTARDPVASRWRVAACFGFELADQRQIAFGVPVCHDFLLYVLTMAVGRGSVFTAGTQLRFPPTAARPAAATPWRMDRLLKPLAGQPPLSVLSCGSDDISLVTVTS